MPQIDCQLYIKLLYYTMECFKILITCFLMQCHNGNIRNRFTYKWKIFFFYDSIPIESCNKQITRSWNFHLELSSHVIEQNSTINWNLYTEDCFKNLAVSFQKGLLLIISYYPRANMVNAIFAIIVWPRFTQTTMHIRYIFLTGNLMNEY